ncbi:MAG: hypothetical protein RLZZ551_1449, partial [Actinomycetota bacterium]
VPAREQVEFIPGALAMAKKDERSGHSEMVRPLQ